MTSRRNLLWGETKRGRWFQASVMINPDDRESNAPAMLECGVGVLNTMVLRWESPEVGDSVCSRII